MNDLVTKALYAESETSEIEFKRKFDTSSTQDWCEITKDIVAIANSGGGIIVFGMDDNGNPSGEDVENVSKLDPAKIADKISKYTDSSFADFQILQREKEEKNRKVVEAPIGSHVVLVPPDEVSSDEDFQMPIRVVTDDPSALKYRKLNPDITHPYRLKEVIEKVNGEIDDREINQYDMIAVNSTHDTKRRPSFCHNPRYSSPQYSTAFVKWIIEQYEKDDQFFDKARNGYYKIRYGGYSEDRY